ncbi:MAG: aldehyde dehydrogenase family protein [Actinomycetota bacterium]|nr:aldehyde dehydrogenase family protein [Actinomycetota bacterium]
MSPLAPATMLIGGEHVPAASGCTREVLNPATGAVVGLAPSGAPEDVERAATAASEAFRGWSQLQARERAHILAGASLAVDARQDEIASILTAEQGKPLAEARGEVSRFGEHMRWCAELADKLAGSQVPLGDRSLMGLVLREPIGVVGAIVPWNHPLTLARNKLSPALAAGNTMVLKPATTTPLSTLAIAAALHDGGLPAGVLNVVVGEGLGTAIVRHALIEKVAFTGSTATGRQVMAAAADGLKRLVLELGGSDPCIVLDDADLDAAVPAIVRGRFSNCGQTCRGIKRCYVQVGAYEEVLGRLAREVGAIEVGDGSRPGVRMGPLHTRGQRDEIEAQLSDALERGAALLRGGGRPDGSEHGGGSFFEPTLLTDVPDDARVMREEVFGPLLPVVAITDLDEGLAKANRSRYGLGASVWTTSAANAWRAVSAFEAGFVWVNSEPSAHYQLPFGGKKESGLGRENGLDALADYTEVKSVVFGGLRL